MVKPGIGEKSLIALLVLVFYFALFDKFYAIVLSILFLISIYFYLKWNYSLFKRLGIPGPPPSILMGNFLEVKQEYGFHRLQIEWEKKYGKIYGSYPIGLPEIVVSDLEVLRNIMVKDFANFTNRRTLKDKDDQFDDKSIFNQLMTVVMDDTWKRIRSNATPAFTSGKLKLMVPLILHCVQSNLDLLEEIAYNKSKIDLKEHFSAFALDTILAVAFGTSVDSMHNPHHPVVQNAKKIFTIFNFENWRLLFFVFFPYLSSKLLDWFGVNILGGKEEEFFKQMLKKMVDERKIKAKSPPDFLQLLTNVEDKDFQEQMRNHEELNESVKIESSFSNIVDKRMSTSEIIAQCFMFLLAGFETMSTALTFTAYMLATHPEIQDQCYDELQCVTNNNDKELTYDLIQNQLPYLESVIFETLRLYPPSIRTDRIAKNRYKIYDYEIPSDVSVSIPIYAIHHSFKLYPEPEKFKPERFTVEERKNRDPLAYIPFGYGPRNCIGMRFAMLQIKLVLAATLQRFKFLYAENTPKPENIELDTTGLTKPKNSLFLKVQRRN